MRKYYISLFILICDFSFAQVVSLTCINPQDNFTLNFQLNERDSSIIYAGYKVYANYTTTTITFKINLDGTEWLHVISRTNGNLMVQNTKNGVVLPTYKCGIEKNKF